MVGVLDACQPAVSSNHFDTIFSSHGWIPTGLEDIWSDERGNGILRLPTSSHNE